MASVTITAAFRYLAPLHRLAPQEPPFRYAIPPPEGRPETNEVLEEHEMPVHDIRGQEDHIGLDCSGFGVLYSIPNVNRRYDDRTWVRETYCPEVVGVLLERLHATRVYIFDYTIRKRDTETEHIPDRPGERQPVYRVHIDQTHEAGRARVFRHLPTEADRLLKSRVQIINVWRPMRGPVRDAPVGMCDARSIREGDMVRQRLIYADREGSTVLAHHNPDHQWFYLSDMQPDEAVLIKCYDNKLPSAVALHSGFSIEQNESALPRQSIEVRCLVFYEDQPVGALE